jgi:hypothetical protein
MKRWEKRQAAAAQYVEAGLETMRLTHADCGPGRNNNNNGEEATHRWTKVGFNYERRGISTFQAQLKEYVGVESAKDYCQRGRWDRFSPAKWNGHIGEYVKSAINSGLSEMAAPMKNGIIVPRQKTLECVDAAATPAKRKAALEPYRKVFRILLGPTPKAALAQMQKFQTQPVQFVDFMDWVQSFALLCPANYPPALTELIHNCMEVPPDRRVRHELFRCHCEDYMHYLVCPHVVWFHLTLQKEKRYWDVLPKAVTNPVKIKHVNNACKQSEGPGAKKRKIDKNKALSRDD